MKANKPYYDVIKSSTNKARWVLRLNRDNGPNIVHGYETFRSKKRAQDWADRMNEAAK